MTVFLIVLACIAYAVIFFVLAGATIDASMNREDWGRAAVLGVVALLWLAGGITATAYAVDDDNCPTGTTQEYHATGDKSGYYYCYSNQAPR